jgi:hypothetical protein
MRSALGFDHQVVPSFKRIVYLTTISRRSNSRWNTTGTKSTFAHWACSSLVRLVQSIHPAYAHLISDEIEFAPPKPPVHDVVGGAGSYSALGARMFSPPPTSKGVGWIVDCGSDFPPELRESIAHWQTGAILRETPERLTTRGWNGYGENEHRGRC